MLYTIIFLLLVGNSDQEQENKVLVELYETKHLHHGVIVKRALVMAQYHRRRANRMQSLHVNSTVALKETEEALMLAETAELDHQRAILFEREAALRLKHVRILAAAGKKVPLPDTDDETMNSDTDPK